MFIAHIVYPSIDRNFSYFHLLAIVNSAAINTVWKYLLKYLFSILWGVYLAMESYAMW